MGTIAELLRVTAYLSKRLGDVGLPFILLHRNVEVVTDLVVNRALYDETSSEAKTTNIYDGMMHFLLLGKLMRISKLFEVILYRG